MDPTLSSRRLTVAFLPVLVALVTAEGSPAHAQTTAQVLAECAMIAADTERLACYDRASGRRAEPPPASPAAAGPAVRPANTATTTALPESATDTAAPASVTAAPPASLIDAAWGFERAASRYTINVYQPNYLLVANYSDNPNQAPFETLFDALDNPDAQLDSTEAQFQISFKARIWATEDNRLGIWLAYTQQSQWQLYNADLSRPFRETNYQPEAMISYNPDFTIGGFRWALFNLGYNHQSNGRSDPISRSWDRIVAEFGIERGNFALLIRPWIITDDGGDDNPDIADYMGHGDITAVYKWHGHSFTVMGRGNLDTGKGAGRVTWTTPPLLGPLRGYVDFFSGYGETMIDYNWRQNTLGIGVTLNDVLDRL